MCQIDEASKTEELFLKVALSAQRKNSGLKPVGSCHYCTEDVKQNQLFCDSFCAGDWETEQLKKEKLYGKRF